MTYEGETFITTLAQLQEVIAAGKLHHCTVRDTGRMFEGLHVYVKDTTDSGFRGFRHVGRIPAHDTNAPREADGQLKANPEYKLALDATRGNWNLGSLGNC